MPSRRETAQEKEAGLLKADTAGGQAGREDRKGVSTLVIVAVFIVIAFLSYKFFLSRGVDSVTQYGVKVVSDKPLSEYIQRIQSQGVALAEPKNKGSLTCSFELIAANISQGRQGYRLTIQDGEQGIFLYDSEGFIKGMSEHEVVTACNAFTCIIGGIACPENLADLGRVFSSAEDVNIVLDLNAPQAGGMGYTELLGVLGFMQVEKLDVNQDGFVSDFELHNVSGNFLAIRPFIMNETLCTSQPLHNLYETFEENITLPCSQLSNTIFIASAGENKIVIENSNIYLYGDNAHLYKEALILRDALSPKWIRVLYQVET